MSTDMWASGPRRAILVLAMVVAGLTAALGFSLAETQSRARGRQESDFNRRAALAARLTAAALASNSAGGPAQSLSGQGKALVSALQAWESGGGTIQQAAVLDASGRILVGWPLGMQRTVSADYPRRDVQLALAGSRRRYGDLVSYGPRKTLLVWVLTPFLTSHGKRVLAELSVAGVISLFAAPYLRSAPGVQGAQAYLIDGHGRVLAASSDLAQGSPLPQHGLTHSVLGGSSSGDLGTNHWTASAVGGGTDWHVVFFVRRATLLAAVQSSDGFSWLLFGGFAASLIALVALGILAIKNSTELGSARERERAARLLAHERLHDALTGLPNRALFLDRATTALQRAQRTGRSVAVMFTDVDHFKRINDSLGHAAGDELLTALADRLSEVIRPQDTVSRFGGDEFVVLCDDLHEEDDALRMAARLSQSLDRPFMLDGRGVHVTCCIGIAICSPSGVVTDPAALIRDADAAMYDAKARGRGQLRVFDEALHADALRRLDTEVALRGDVERGELMVHYQPIVALRDRRVTGVEALARWHRDGHGLVPPIEFIPLAEEYGLITALGRHVLETAMRDVRAWHEAGLLSSGFLLSVNVSPTQLADGDFPALVAELLRKWPLPPETLCLEVTESAVGADPKSVQCSLTRLSELGLKIAIDDFGVGLSSLKQLAGSLPVDLIKLDRSFVAEMDNARERAVVAAVAPMASALGMAAIAEGVEQSNQAEELIALGYTLAQGYHFGKPASAETLRSALAREAGTLVR